MSVAVCRQCKKRYRIRGEVEDFTCKSCGGPLVAVKVRNTGRSAAGGSRQEAPETDPAQRSGEKETVREIRKIMGLMTAVRAAYLFGAIVYGYPWIATLVLALKLESTTVLKILYSLPMLLMLLATCLFLLGAWMVVTRPFLCSIVLASLVTIHSLGLFWQIIITGEMYELVLLTGTIFMDLFAGLLILVVMFLWGAVAAAANVRKMAGTCPDATITRRLAIQDGKLVRVKVLKREGSPGEVMGRYKARRRQARSQLIRLGGIGVGIAVLVFMVWCIMQPPSLPSRSKALQLTWNDAPNTEEAVSGVVAFFKAESRDKIRGQLKRMFKGYGWQESIPRLGEAQIEENETTLVRITYPTFMADGETEGEGEFETSWSKDRYDNWNLRSLRFQ